MAMTFEAPHNFKGTCKGCGKSFIAYVRPSKTRKYCSQECGQRSMAGTTQSADHLAKRIKHGPNHQNWVGDAATEKSGRSRALRMYPVVKPCQNCGNAHGERHHKDGNTLNNAPGNIESLCRRCHMEEDGRLAKLANLNRKPS